MIRTLRCTLTTEMPSCKDSSRRRHYPVPQLAPSTSSSQYSSITRLTCSGRTRKSIIKRPQRITFSTQQSGSVSRWLPLLAPVSRRVLRPTAGSSKSRASLMPLVTFLQHGCRICSATSSLSTRCTKRLKRPPRRRTPRRSTSGTDASQSFSLISSHWWMKILTLSMTSLALTKISCLLMSLSSNPKRKRLLSWLDSLSGSQASAKESLPRCKASSGTASLWLTAL